jgi:hypothetical protein
MRIIIDLDGTGINELEPVEKEVMVSSVINDISESVSDYWIKHVEENPLSYPAHRWQGSSVTNFTATLKVEDSK